jgi:hypothetical protein
LTAAAYYSRLLPAKKKATTETKAKGDRKKANTSSSRSDKETEGMSMSDWDVNDWNTFGHDFIDAIHFIVKDYSKPFERVMPKQTQIALIQLAESYATDTNYLLADRTMNETPMDAAFTAIVSVGTSIQDAFLSHAASFRFVYTCL